MAQAPQDGPSRPGYFGQFEPPSHQTRFYIAQRTINEHFDILVMHGSVVVVCLVLSSELMLQLELNKLELAKLVM